MRAVCRERVYLLSKLAVGVAALGALGCGGGGGASPPAMQTASAAVTPAAGGTVKLPDNSVQLNVPPGAVPADTMITMTTTDATAPQGITARSPILQFEPDGTVFQKPVTVTFTFKSATNPVVFWSNSSGGYDLIEGTVTGTTIAAPVMHFSKGFVGERPMGGSDKCGDGVACTAGATCGFGGTPTMSGGSNSGTGATGGTMTGASFDGGAMAGGPNSGPPKTDPGSMGTAATGGGTGATGGGTGPTGTGTMGGAADASVGAVDPGTKPAAMSALSASDPSTAAVCCSCGADGVFHCSLCQGSNDSTGGTNTGSDGGVMASPCVQGGSCSPGTGCGMGGGTTFGGPAGGGSTNTGAPMSGSASADGTGTGAPQTAPSSGGACCMCGSDGHYQCTSPCSAPMGGGVDASAGGGTFGSHDGGAIMGGGTGGSNGTGIPPAQCVQGTTCQPGSAPCGDASPTSCTMCMCGADGTLACAACDGTQAPDGGMSGGTPPAMCVAGAACAAGTPPCADASPASCTMCMCGQAGTLVCQPCPGSVKPDGGMTSPPSDAGAVQIDPTQCQPGLQCPQVGAACGSGPTNGVCTKCMCGSDHLLACQQMAC
jgi:hypothetical protein